MNDLMQKLAEWMIAAESVFQEYGPQALEATLVIIRIDAIFNLVVGGGGLAILYGTYRAALYGHEKIVADKLPGYEVLYIPLFFVLMFPALVGICIATNLVNVYYWIAAYDPILGLVYKAAESAGLL